MAIWRSNLGSVLQALGDLEGARVQHERALELDRQLHDAGFTTTRWVQLIPLQSFHAVVAER